jgi:hypothetical protein
MATTTTEFRLPQYSTSFHDIVQIKGFLGFCRDVDYKNAKLPPVDRPTMEGHWTQLLSDKFKEWILYNTWTEALQKDLFKKAILQVRFYLPFI